MARIGVEPTLTHVKTALIEMGHDVIDLRSESDATNCDCCIISGQDKDLMGIQDAVIEGPVINAEGATADDVLQMVEQRLS